MASKAFCAKLQDLYPNDVNGILIVCGPGNNGGDGFAIAKLLGEIGYEVTVLPLYPAKSKDSNYFMGLAKKAPNVKFCSELPAILKFSLIIDAIFGIGLSRPLSIELKDTIKSLNESHCPIISVDIASGLQCKEGQHCIKPLYTFAFHTPIIDQLLPENSSFVGKLFCLDIGLSRAFQSSLVSNQFWLTKDFVASLFKREDLASHKGTFGSLHIIAGKYGSVGAAMLCAKAALRSGVGKVFLSTNECSFNAIHTAVPEAILLSFGTKHWENQILEESNTIAVGPGLGTNSATIQSFTRFLNKSTGGLVLDADALNIIAEEKLHELIPKGSILTPHPKEFDKLFGKSKNRLDRLEKALIWCKKLDTCIVLKGKHSVIITPDERVVFNSTGNPGMATAGSGDALTGIIGAFLAQAYAPDTSALLGVYIHGMAGDNAFMTKGRQGMIASDIIEALPSTFIEIKSRNS